MIVLGLTGGIAAGKSTVARHLARLGAVVIDADKLGHKVYARGQPGFDNVLAAFGKEVMDADGEIDRKALGSKVFGNAEQLQRLTDIVWPEILALARTALEAARSSAASVAVLEAAVLIEANWHREVDEVWVVTIPAEVAIARASARDGVDVATVQARIDAQLSTAERLEHAHAVLDNSGSRADLLAQVERHWRRLDSVSV